MIVVSRSGRARSEHGFCFCWNDNRTLHASAGVSRRPATRQHYPPIGLDPCRERRNRRCIEEILEREVDAKRARRRDSICATVKELAPSAKMSWSTLDLIEVKELLPCLRQLQLQFRARRNRFAAAISIAPLVA